MTDLTPEQVARDAAIAALWPSKWMAANNGRCQSKKRNNLRKAYRFRLEMDAFRSANPTASCASCRHYERMPHDTRMHCSIKGDWEGYSLAKHDGLCLHYKLEQTNDQ